MVCPIHLQVDAERTYHQTVADILNKLHDEVHNYGFADPYNQLLVP